MAEQIQVQQVTMKDPKKVEAGKKLAEWNCRIREKGMYRWPKLKVNLS